MPADRASLSRGVATIGEIPDALRAVYGRHFSDDGWGWDWETDPLAEQAAQAIELLLVLAGEAPDAR